MKILVLNVVFRDGDNFCKAFAGAQVNLSYHEWRSLVRSLVLLQCKLSIDCFFPSFNSLHLENTLQAVYNEINGYFFLQLNQNVTTYYQWIKTFCTQ